MCLPDRTDSQRFEFRNVKYEDINNVLPAIGTSKKGAKILYHTGFMFRDRLNNKELVVLAERLMDFQMIGLVNLVQKKLSDYNYQYFAIVR